MTPTHVIKIALIILSFYYAQTKSQEIPSKKIFLLFEKNKGDYPYYRGLKFVNNKGVNFNLLNSAGFIHKNGYSRDTLPICKLKNFPLTEESEIRKKEQNWRKENENFRLVFFENLHFRFKENISLLAWF